VFVQLELDTLQQAELRIWITCS